MNKQISHDELRTRLIGAGTKDLDTLEEKVSCYPDCHCDDTRTNIVINLLQGALDHLGGEPDWSYWEQETVEMIKELKETTK